MGSRSRRRVIAGNWKMHGLQSETRAFFAELAHSPTELSSGADTPVEWVIFPAMTSLGTAVDLARELPMTAIGSQNTHWEMKGAFTGEVSGPMLTELGISWSLVGHSERRQFFAETMNTARLRTHSLLEQGLQVILCVGETLSERESGRTEAVLEEGILSALTGLSAELIQKQLLIAYEPVWAIGTGQVATPEQAQDAHHFIRGLLSDAFDSVTAQKVPILYGGSVKPDNCEQILKQPDVDGALIGGASLSASSFLEIARLAKKVMVGF